ncbi:MAG: hypothetical protein ABIQ52_13990 [Vicinamibacterales bacterium]
MEKVTGRKYDEALADQILSPLGMNDTESDTRFYSDSPEATLTFTVTNGVASQLVLNVNGRDRIARRMQ